MSSGRSLWQRKAGFGQAPSSTSAPDWHVAGQDRGVLCSPVHQQAAWAASFWGTTEAFAVAGPAALTGGGTAEVSRGWGCFSGGEVRWKGTTCTAGNIGGLKKEAVAVGGLGRRGRQIRKLSGGGSNGLIPIG